MAADDKHRVTRRGFMHTAGAIAATAVPGTLASVPRTAAASVEGDLPRRVLGRTKLEVTCMTFGAAPSGIAKDVTVDEVGTIVNTAIDLGINFVDTAPRYGKSEEGIGRALGRRRKDIYLATKVWADTIADAEESLANSLKTLKTDYFDVLYFHHLGDRQVDRARDPDGVFTWLLKQKQAGKCRFVGISGHNLPDRFPPFLETGEVDVILVNINFADRYTYGFEDKVLPVARKHDVGIVSMKAFGGPDPKTGSWGKRDAKPLVGKENLELAIRYSLSVPGVATANLGVHTVEQLRENVDIVKRFQPLSAEERELTVKLGKKMAKEWGPHFGPVGEAAEDSSDAPPKKSNTT